jgi:hypothetical protein
LCARSGLVIELVDSSWENDDLDGLVGLLTEEVILSMPPMGGWFKGRAAERSFFAWAWAPSGPGPFRLVATGANGQPAFGLYGLAPAGGGFTPQAIQVLTSKARASSDCMALSGPTSFRLSTYRAGWTTIRGRHLCTSDASCLCAPGLRHSRLDKYRCAARSWWSCAQRRAVGSTERMPPSSTNCMRIFQRSAKVLAS